VGHRRRSGPHSRDRRRDHEILFAEEQTKLTNISRLESITDYETVT
jgi:hypothetical protein